ncbi:hypothetical protein GCM10022252_75780 [Streptosporangium oxazolinicum]|uniref:Uncharacterized protein n=1 Tax=Streptosporangium oxazolinicum TaxID=909287 RepID=A0ABP8BL06_9ACTN
MSPKQPPAAEPPPAGTALATREPATPGLLARALRWLLRWIARKIAELLLALLRRLARRLLRHRDLHVTWWGALALYVTSTVMHLLLLGLTGMAWWSVLALGAACAGVVAGLYQQLGRTNPLPYDRLAVTGAAAAAAAWATAAATAGPISQPVAITWAVLLIVIHTVWGLSKPARAWRHLRLRVRNWSATLPGVVAQLSAASITLAARPIVHGNGRVDFPLRVSGTTRAKLDKLRTGIEVEMQWPENSVREVIPDPTSTSAGRVLLVWSEGKIAARKVKFAPPQMPTSIYEAVWVGINDEGSDVYVVQYAPGHGMTRGLYGGESGSAKSNLLRLIAYMRAYCGDVLIWCIDLKNDGLTYAHLMPRLDRPIATTPEAAARILADGAAAIPLRGRLLTADDNQLLSLNTKRPGILIIGDEVSTLLGKAPANADAIASAKNIGGKGRALGVGMEAAAQYLSQDSLHPALLPLFNRRYAGRTASPADAQHLLKRWNRYDTTLLPTGVFLTQQSGSNHTELLYTPEVTDAMLGQAAADTAHLTPVMEASTAAALPHYGDRWDDMEDHLMPYATEKQRGQVYATRARLESARLHAAKTPARAAAATSKTGRVVVVEHLDDDQTPAAPAVELTLASITDESLRTMAELHLSSPMVTTSASNQAAAPRARQWATYRRNAWVDRGLIESDGHGKWRTLVTGERDMVLGVRAGEADIRNRRTGGGDPADTHPADTDPDLRIPPQSPSSDQGSPAEAPRQKDGSSGGVAPPPAPSVTSRDSCSAPGPPPPTP